MRYGYVALGSNLSRATGTSREICNEALGLFLAAGLRITQRSSWYSAPAFPSGSGPDYVNGVVKIETGLTAPEALFALHAIESQLGRTRPHRWASRIIDLDLLAFDAVILPDRAGFERWASLPLSAQMEAAPDELILPHPRMQDRAFVLVPLAEIAPNWMHPVFRKTAAEMCADLPSEAVAGILPL